MKKSSATNPPVSPAARALVSELQERGLIHQAELKAVRRWPIAEELLRLDLAVALEDGHVAETAWVENALSRVSEIGHITHKEAAALLGLSNGQSRALLSYYVRHGRMRRDAGVFRRVLE
jgi:hypothetical protein